MGRSLFALHWPMTLAVTLHSQDSKDYSGSSAPWPDMDASGTLAIQKWFSGSSKRGPWRLVLKAMVTTGVAPWLWKPSWNPVWFESLPQEGTSHVLRWMIYELTTQVGSNMGNMLKFTDAVFFCGNFTHSSRTSAFFCVLCSPSPNASCVWHGVNPT